MNISQVNFPLEIPQRADFNETIQIFNLDGTPMDLTDYTAKMEVRKSYVDTDIVVSLTTNDDTITIDGVNGKISLFLPAATTTGLPAPLDCVYDLLIFAPSPSTVINRILRGTICISPGSTRSS